MIIFLDTETTGLIEPVGTDLQYQPHITELYALKTTMNCKIISPWHSMFKVPVQIQPHITRLTGITNDHLEDKPRFKKKYKSLKNFMKGVKIIVAHNLYFDMQMIQIEHERIIACTEKKKPFKFPKQKFCTVEQSLHLTGYRLTLKELYQKATGKTEIENAHRAESDVLALVECYKWLTK